MAEINFFWDPLSDNILQERDETGAVTAEYTAEPGLYGNIISQNRGGVESQFHYDAQGSTLAVTDDNQNVTDTFAYSAFGEVTERTGTTEVPFQYIGQKGYYTDSLTGQCLVRERPYEPARARWSAADSVLTRAFTNLLAASIARVVGADIGGIHSPYQYCRNAPIHCVDPSGLLCYSTTTVPATENACSGVKRVWTVEWNLQGEMNGYLLQRVTRTPDVVARCLLANLTAAKFACVERGVAGCHRAGTNAAHTDSACAALKSLAATDFSLPGIVDCKPCTFPLSYANDCSECPDYLLYATFTSLCRDATPDKLSVASYCKTEADKNRLAVILVHEAAHGCVGGHTTTGKKLPSNEPSCDKCNRNDSYDIDAAFKKCLT